MKAWIIYIGATLFGFAASTLLGAWQPYISFIGFMVPIVKDLTLFFLFPLVFILFTAESASLRRHKDTSHLYLSTIFWSLATTLLLTLAAMGLAVALPKIIQFSFPVSTEALPAVERVSFNQIRDLLFSDNAFTQFTRSTSSLLPILVVAAVAGYALKPDYEALRPAYVVTNSFAEVAMRLSRIITISLSIPVFFISAAFTTETALIDAVYASMPLTLSFLGLSLIAVIILLPLIYAVFTGFRKGNPYRLLFGALASLITSFLFMSTLESTISMIALGEHNNNVKKRISGTAFPLYTIIGKGGSSMIATFTLIIVLQTAQMMEFNLMTLVVIVLFSSLVSLLSSFVPRFEVVFIMMFTFYGLTGTFLQETLSPVIILLPLIQAFAALVDTGIAILGASFTSRLISQEDSPLYHQMM
ncbi:MAG: cation:dicarboxylase symporter family transporter [Sphaerochaetaceae bacterium]|nr:cation:dicarboxylase symporter family transporter [Sphaerochaetaceae bacterium]